MFIEILSKTLKKKLETELKLLNSFFLNNTICFYIEVKTNFSVSDKKYTLINLKRSNKIHIKINF